jgi:hypothetical protein
MIKGKKKLDLSIDTILSRITPYDIFKHYMPGKWRVNIITHSPFHVDEHPSFMIGNKTGRLGFIDFADDSKKGDCFEFVKMLYNVPSLDALLKMIDRDFNLGIVKGELTEKTKILARAEHQPEEMGKRYSLIQASTRAFTGEELAYWNSFHQDITDLKREQIYSIDKLYLNKKLFSLKDTELRFGYFYNGHWKIYRPFAPRRQKWVPNNVPIHYMDGKKDIKNCHNAFINKSKKDYMVIKKVYQYTCAVQYEGDACFTEDNVKYLKENSDIQTLSFDSDVAGVKNSQQITKKHDFDYCNVHKMYIREKINDWAGLAKDYGLETVEDYLTQKGIITK